MGTLHRRGEAMSAKAKWGLQLLDHTWLLCLLIIEIEQIGSSGLHRLIMVVA